jgi:hypothetical protein
VFARECLGDLIRPVIEFSLEIEEVLATLNGRCLPPLLKDFTGRLDGLIDIVLVRERDAREFLTGRWVDDTVTVVATSCSPLSTDVILDGVRNHSRF